MVHRVWRSVVWDSGSGLEIWVWGEFGEEGLGVQGLMLFWFKGLGCCGLVCRVGC